MSTSSPVTEAATTNKRNLLSILYVLFSWTMGIGLNFPVEAQVLREVVGGDAGKAAQYYSLSLSMNFLLSFLSAPILGVASDILKTRKKILAFQMLVTAVYYGILGFIAVTKPSVVFYFAAKILVGLLGNVNGVISAYISDISPPSQRAQNMGLLGMCFGLAFMVGPVLSGNLTSAFGIPSIYIAICIIETLAFLFATFFLNESFKEAPSTSTAAAGTGSTDKPQSFDLVQILKYANPLKSFSILWQHGKFLSHLSFATFWNALTATAFQAIWVNYAAYRYSFTAKENGYFLGAFGLGHTITQAVLMKKIVGRLGERNSILLALLANTLSAIIVGVASSSWIAYATLPFSVIAGIHDPLLKAMLSKQVPENRQGSLQGAYQSMFTMANAVAPIIYSKSFQYFTSADAPAHIPGAPFFIAATFAAISLVLTHFALKTQGDQQQQATTKKE